MNYNELKSLHDVSIIYYVELCCSSFSSFKDAIIHRHSLYECSVECDVSSFVMCLFQFLYLFPDVCHEFFGALLIPKRQNIKNKVSKHELKLFCNQDSFRWVEVVVQIFVVGFVFGVAGRHFSMGSSLYSLHMIVSKKEAGRLHPFENDGRALPLIHGSRLIRGYSPFPLQSQGIRDYNQKVIENLGQDPNNSSNFPGPTDQLTWLIGWLDL